MNTTVNAQTLTWNINFVSFFYHTEFTRGATFWDILCYFLQNLIHNNEVFLILCDYNRKAPKLNL